MAKITKREAAALFRRQMAAPPTSKPDLDPDADRPTRPISEQEADRILVGVLRLTEDLAGQGVSRRDLARAVTEGALAIDLMGVADAAAARAVAERAMRETAAREIARQIG